MSELSAITDDSASTSTGLLQRVRARDTEAWRQLVQLYGPLVVRWCMRDKLSEADAADIVQDVFRAVAEHIDRFRKDRPSDSFHGWLRTITENAKRDFWRRERKQPHGAGGTTFQQILSQVPEASDASLFSADEMREETLALQLTVLQRIRAEFSERVWQAFWRTAVDGLNATEVGQELGMTSVAVRTAKARVLRRLRESLADPDGF